MTMPARLAIPVLFAALVCAAPVRAADMTMAPVAAPASTGVAVRGAVTQPRTWTLDDLKKMPAQTVNVTQQTDHGPVSGSFAGVLLWSLIDQAGPANGPEKNAYLRHTILVSGTDNYAVALSEGEIDPKLEGKQVLIAYMKDGTPLDGPRLVVPGDAHASRGVHDVAAIEVR
ncbi:MAG TPA: molybdopterin-dependent oxidoreductase [Rhizomicrobium sp.]|jgi:DMSO/TMAO reductase YedYZ molybdopterin-dependent catalytic subunit